MVRNEARSFNHLMDQVRYMLDEVEALTALIGRVPDDVLEARPLPGDLSVKEWYGAIIRVQEAYIRSEPASWGDPDMAARLVREESGDYWNGIRMSDILDRLVEGRGALLERLEKAGAPAAAGAARDIVEVDRECQRQISARLFEMRPPPTPISRQV